jgi:hypothetical protein
MRRAPAAERGNACSANPEEEAKVHVSFRAADWAYRP